MPSNVEFFQIFSDVKMSRPSMPWRQSPPCWIWAQVPWLSLHVGQLQLVPGTSTRPGQIWLGDVVKDKVQEQLIDLLKPEVISWSNYIDSKICAIFSQIGLKANRSAGGAAFRLRAGRSLQVCGRSSTSGTSEQQSCLVDPWAVSGRSACTCRIHLGVWWRNSDCRTLNCQKKWTWSFTRSWARLLVAKAQQQYKKMGFSSIFPSFVLIQPMYSLFEALWLLSEMPNAFCRRQLSKASDGLCQAGPALSWRQQRCRNQRRDSYSRDSSEEYWFVRMTVGMRVSPHLH